MDDRAVSNTLGYVLLFAVVFASIAAVGTAGVDSLTAARDVSIERNAEHTMTGIASAVEDVHKENVSRTSRVGLGGGSIEAGGETHINVSIGRSWINQTVDPIVYRTGDTQLIYVAGAVFRLEEHGQVPVRKPDYSIPGVSDQRIISLPLTQSADSGSTISGSNAIVRLSRSSKSQKVETGSSIRVEFNTPSERRAELWKAAVKSQFDSCTIQSDTSKLECRYPEDVLFRTTTTTFNLET